MSGGSGFLLQWCRPGTDGAEVVTTWQYGSRFRALMGAKSGKGMGDLEPWLRGPKGGRSRVPR